MEENRHWCPYCQTWFDCEEMMGNGICMECNWSKDVSSQDPKKID